MLIGHLYILFCEVSFWSFFYHMDHLIDLQDFSMYSGYKPFVSFKGYNYLPFCGLHFSLLMMSFEEYKFLKSIQPNLLIFSFKNNALCVCVKKSFPSLDDAYTLLYYILELYYFLPFTFRSTIYLKQILACNLRQEWFILSICISSCPNTTY